MIIEESLDDKKPLKLVKIVNTRQTTLEKEEGKGILHFHEIEVQNDKKDNFVQISESSIKHGWYIHIVKNGEMIVVFKNKIFSFRKSDKNSIEKAKNYGVSIGILREQMDFKNLIGDPWD